MGDSGIEGKVQFRKRNDNSSRAKGFINRAKWLRQRELNVFPKTYSLENDTTNVIYHSLLPIGRLPGDDAGDRCEHGGIFGMDFSPDGSVLAAACEAKTLLLIDPLTRRVIRKAPRIHGDCVNLVKFLDSRLFATCSDDHTVKLWDLRYVKEEQPVRVLRGHTNWVKNIEYIPADGILLTSGFDHFVYSWEINKYVESDAQQFKRVFHTPGLIRMCLTSDKSKMIISTQWGYLLVIHNFDVYTCGADLMGFKPNTCWMMLKAVDMAQPSYLKAIINRFSAPKNRPELIVDFPEANNAENITAITPHPHGWCVLSRNTSADTTTEWSCVHDIQLPPVDDLLANEGMAEECGNSPHSDDQPDSMESQKQASESDEEESSTDEDEPLSTEELENRFLLFSNFVRFGTNRRRTVRMSTGGSLHPPRTARMSTGGRRPGLPMHPLHSRHRRSGARGRADLDNLLPKSYTRLSHCIEEANVGRGFIKEQSFSSDGRLVASPFGFGVRLLAFDQNCSELCHVCPLRMWGQSGNRDGDEEDTSQSDQLTPCGSSGASGVKKTKMDTMEKVEPRQLYEVGMNVCHNSPVLCAQFSPLHYLLATGCYYGKIGFHQPVL